MKAPVSGAWLLRCVLWLGLGILVLAPLASIVIGADVPSWLGHSGDADTQQSSPLAEAVRNSLLLGISVVVISSAAALVLAWLMEYYPPPLAWLWEALIYLPFFSAPYLLGLAWSAVALPGSMFSRPLGPLAAPLSSFVFSLPGIAFITASHMAPLTYTLLRGYLAGSGGKYEMAARVHGLGRWATLVYVTLPRLAVPLGAGALLAFLAAIEELGVPAILGPYVGLNVLTTSIESDLDVWPINLVDASRKAVILLVIGGLAWGLYRRFDQSAGLDFSRLGTGRARRHWAGFVVVVWALVTGLLPMLVLLAQALLRADTQGLHWNNLTLAHFGDVLRPGRSGYRALMTSVTLALAGSLIALSLASVIAFVRREGRRGDETLDMVTTLLNALPGVVLAVGLVLVWNAPWNPLPLYGTPLLLLLAYVTVLLPLVLRYAHTAVARVEPGLLTAASVHGVGRGLMVMRIVLPLMLPPLIGGFALAFAFGLREFTTSVLLQPPGTDTVSTFIFNEVLQGNGGAAMAMAVISLLVSFAAVGILRWVQRPQRTGA